MNARVGIYLRDDRVIVVPQAGGGGEYYDVDHVLVVPAAESEVQRALEEAIEVSSTACVSTDRDSKNWPVLKALRLKSARAFYRNVSHVAVSLYEGKLEIEPYDPTKRGQAFEGVRPVVLVASMTALGALVLKALKESPRMNPQP